MQMSWNTPSLVISGDGYDKRRGYAPCWRPGAREPAARVAIRLGRRSPLVATAAPYRLASPRPVAGAWFDAYTHDKNLSLQNMLIHTQLASACYDIKISIKRYHFSNYYWCRCCRYCYCWCCYLATTKYNSPFDGDRQKPFYRGCWGPIKGEGAWTKPNNKNKEAL